MGVRHGAIILENQSRRLYNIFDRIILINAGETILRNGFSRLGNTDGAYFSVAKSDPNRLMKQP